MRWYSVLVRLKFGVRVSKRFFFVDELAMVVGFMCSKNGELKAWFVDLVFLQ